MEIRVPYDLSDECVRKNGTRSTFSASTARAFFDTHPFVQSHVTHKMILFPCHVWERLAVVLTHGNKIGSSF